MSFDELLQEMVDQQDQLLALAAISSNKSCCYIVSFFVLALDWHPTIILLDVSGALKKSYLD